ncbi:MAG: MATE family efflux transporter [Lachnospiraceae bacterium]|nr:MATE family efflux transporter [Lachnospiraceae bacterium]
MHKTKKKTYEIDMVHGPLTGKILLFAVPLMISGILQLLFNAADIIVVGQFASDYSVAAVGSTGSLINLLVSVFMGLSVGVNVIVAHYHAIAREEDVSETVHTAVVTSFFAGLFLTFFGMLLAAPLLSLMGTPDEVLPLAAVYLRIYFAGMCVNLLYNIGSAVLRATGDTRRPLFYLTIAGVVNVILNLFFVIVLHMDVAGVALATILSQCISAVLVLRCLATSEGSYRLERKKLRIKKDKLLRILQIGLPAGLQGSVFSLSNVIIQSSVNAFGAMAMAGNAAGANIEGFVYVSMNAFYQACVTFVSQNFGAHEWKRVKRVLVTCLVLVAGTGLVLGNLCHLFARPLVSLYTSDPDAVSVGMMRISVICTVYLVCGMMEVACGAVRGLGAAITPMIVATAGACGLRILWILTIFRMPGYHTLRMLYLSYPVSWVVTGIAHLVCFILLLKRAQQALSRP